MNNDNKKNTIFLLRILQRLSRTISWIVALLFMLHLLPRLAFKLQHTEGGAWVCYLISITICLIAICISILKLNDILSKKINNMR